jgi:hypothetical protein
MKVIYRSRCRLCLSSRRRWFPVPVLAGDHHGHCSGANVCAGDAACVKQGYKELSKDECSKIDGAKFEGFVS